MNHENINKVIDWLNRGAPEVVFSMVYSLRLIDDTGVEDREDDRNGYYGLAPSEQAKVDEGSCGSVCCIAGAAVQFAGVKPDDPDYNCWSPIQNRALKFFGITPTGTIPWMLPVFDPEEAPDNCPPQLAAKALKLWAKHAQQDITFNPWPEITE